MRCKMDQLVRWGNGEIASPRAMLDQGKAEVRIVERFAATSKSKPRRAVFVDLIGTQCGVEVSGYVKPMTDTEMEPFAKAEALTKE